MPTLVVYGATSYTATQHLLPYLASHPDADKFELVLAGRNAGRLEAANALLPGSTRRIVALSLDDKAAVEGLVAKADGVVNLAGPYSKHNAIALVEACAKLGKHYFDLTGEVWWLHKSVIQWDYVAAKTGACIVPMCGFEALPGDISIYHGLRTLQAREGRNVAFKESTNYYDIAGGVSGGTIASVKAFAESGEKPDIDEWALIGASVVHVNSPQSLVYTPPRVPGVPAYGAWYVGGSTNRATFRRSWWLSKLRGSSISQRENNQFSAAQLDAEPRHGEHTVFKEALHRQGKSVASSWFGTLVMSLVVMIGAGLYVSSSFFRRLVEKFIPQPGQGPSPEVCNKGWTRVTNVSETDDPKNPLTVVTHYSAKGDPGYSHTARILAEVALALVLPPPTGQSLPPLAQVGGVLTPATAGGAVLIERLKKYGVAQIETEIVKPGAETEGRKTI